MFVPAWKDIPFARKVVKQQEKHCSSLFKSKCVPKTLLLANEFELILKTINRTVHKYMLIFNTSSNVGK